jgi:hypothetical protein
MILPASGLLIGYASFAVLGLFVLRFFPGPGLRLGTLIAFVFSAHAGTAAYAFVFGPLFADAQRQFTSETAGIIFFCCIPIFAGAFGWVGASIAVRFLKKPQA